MNSLILTDRTLICFYAIAMIFLILALIMFVVGLPKSSSTYISEEEMGHSCLRNSALAAFAGLLLIMVGNLYVKPTEWHRFEEAVSADSGYTFYYNGQAVSGAALGIDENDIGYYKFKYDPVNKTVIIRDRE